MNYDRYAQDLLTRHLRGEHRLAHPDCMPCITREEADAPRAVITERVYLTPQGAAVARAL